MTQIGLGYLNLVETRRANRAKENISQGELNERVRHQTTSEGLELEDLGIKRSSLDETGRANRAKEAENHRSNVAKETENYRSNVAKETENTRGNTLKHLNDYGATAYMAGEGSIDVPTTIANTAGNVTNTMSGLSKFLR